MNKKILILLMVAGMVMWGGGEMYGASITTYCKAATSNLISNESGQPLAEGSYAQLIRSSDTNIGTPDAHGVPSGGDLVAAVGYIGATPESNYGTGEIKVIYAGALGNDGGNYFALRAWNGVSPELSSKYGTSVTTFCASNTSIISWWPAGFLTINDAPGSAPNISGVIPAVVHLGQMITVDGTALGSGETGSYVSVNGWQVPSGRCISWSSTKIELTAEAEMTAMTNAAVIVHKSTGQDSNTNTSMSIDPWVTTAAPTANLVTGVSKVTFTGGGFGSGRGSSVVRYNGAISVSPGSQYPAWAVNSLDSIVASGATDGLVTVEVPSSGGRKSNGTAFTMATPSISTINPNTGNIGATAVISGSYMGTVESGQRASSANRATFNGAVMADGAGGVTAWVNNAVTFVAQSVVSASNNNTVVVRAGGHDSNTLTFTVTPDISTPATMRISQPMTVSGHALGGSQGGSSVIVGSDILAVTTWNVGGTSVTGTLPNTIQPGTRNVQVTVEASGLGGPYRTNVVQVHCTPYITQISPIFGAPGTVVTIEGYGFGATKVGSFVRFGGTGVAIYGAWSNNTIEVVAPSAATGNVDVTNGELSNGRTFTYGNSPAILGFITPLSRAVGQMIWVTGENFGADPGPSNRDAIATHITFGGILVPADKVSLWSATQIAFEIPIGVPIGAGITLEITAGSINSAPNNDITVTSAGGGGLANIRIYSIRFDGRTYVTGEIVSATPVITATITPAPGETFDITYKDVRIDNVPLPDADITYEVTPGMPLGSYQVRARVRTPISAQPLKGHTVTIKVHNLTGDEAIWNGSIAVMSGGVQVVGSVYNYPNPFKPLSGDPNQNTTKIAYSLSVDAGVTLIIYDITGHEVHRATFSAGVEGGRAGVNNVSWQGRDLFGGAVGNGMYVYKLISGNRVIGTGKLVVLD